MSKKIKDKSSKLNAHHISIIVIIGMVFIIYAQSVKFNFSYFDDYTILLENKEFFTTDFSFKKAFTTSAFVKEDLLYRPLQNLSFALDAKIAGGIVPWAFHFTNIVLFIFIGLSLYFLLIKFNISKNFALLGTLLFVANPLNVWSVVWIPARGDLFLTLFTLLSFICFINFVKSNRFLDLFFTFLCFTFALFSKETAAIIPLLFLFYFSWKEKPFFNKINYKHLLLGGVMLAMGIIWFFLRKMAVTQTHEIFSFQDVVRNFLNIPVALSQIVFPYEMSPFPKFTLTKTILGCATLITLLYLGINKNEISKWENLFYFLWFFLFLLPTFYAKFLHMDYFEHRYLLPQIGILLLLIKRLSVTKTNSKSKLPRYFISFLILPIFTITSFIKAQNLQNPDTLLKATVKHDGITVIPYLNRSGYFIDLGKYEQATKDLGKVLQFDPLNYEAIINLAKINLLIANYENAVTFYSMSISLNNKDFRMYEHRSQAKIGLGDLQGALLDVDSALLLNQSYYQLYNNRGVLKMNLGLFEEALPDFEEAKRLTNASNVDILYNCAVVKYRFDDFEGALKDCKAALQLDPDNLDILKLRENITYSQSLEP